MEDDSWIRNDGELGCNNSPKRMKLGTEPGVTTGKWEKDNRRHPRDNHSRDWDGGREETGPGTKSLIVIHKSGKKDGKIGAFRGMKEKDEKDDLNGIQRNQPRTTQTKRIMKARDDAIPKGLLDKQLEIMSRGLGDGRETINDQ